MRRLLTLLSAAGLVASLALAGGASAAPVPAGATWSEAYFPSADGTSLHADVLLPKGGEKRRHPVILSIGPYFGTSSQDAPLYDPRGSGPSDRFNDLIAQGRIFERDYAFVMVDSRGFGGSGGCNDLGGKGEQSDVKAAVEWAARQPWSTGKVGMWGKSYDAWTQVMALATAPKGLAATVIQSPIIDGYRIAFQDGVHWSAGWYVTPSLYADYDLTPPALGNSLQYKENYLTGAATAAPCVATNLASTPDPDRGAAYWRERDLVARAGASRVPTFWSHGFNDVNTKPTNIFDVYSRLRGPKRAWFGQWDHVRGNQADLVGRDGFMTEAMAWFDHYLKGKPLPRLPRTEVQDADGAWRTEADWPPADGVRRSMPVKAGSYTDRPGNADDRPTDGTFTVSQPAPHDVRIAGSGSVRVSASAPAPGANLVALLYDVSPSGAARVVTRGAARLTGSATTVELFPADYLLPAGDRLALQLSAADDSVYQPTWTGSPVTVTGGALTLPLLTFARSSDLAGDQAVAARRVARATLGAAQLAGRESTADFGPPQRRR